MKSTKTNKRRKPRNQLMPNNALRFIAAIANWTPVSLNAAGDDREAPADGLRRFAMTAYTGGPMLVGGWDHPVVVDLAGLQISAKPRPILKDHNASLIVGHTDAISTIDHTLAVSGTISGAGRVAQEVVSTADNGFPWQASLGATVQKAVFVPQGRSAHVNGQDIDGPTYIARTATLGEVSFVALGADDATEARVLAGAPNTPINHSLEILPMDFEAWLTDQGFVLAELSKTQQNNLQALFDGQANNLANNQANNASQNTADTTPPSDADPAAAMRVAAATEADRIASIRTLCNGDHTGIEAQAIREGWDTTKTELEILRANRPQAPAIHSSPNHGTTSDVLTAACVLSAKLAKPEDHCDEKNLDAAAKQFRGGIGLQELILEAAWANGYTGRNFRDTRSILRAAFAAPIAASQLSSIDLGGILSNVANKFLLEGFFAVERVWRNITAVRSVSDFKTVTSYRLVGANQYELVAPGGEIKHGQLGEESYSNKADTHGLMLSIDRRDIINDDLGAITAVPRMLGRGSGLKINDVFWSTFLNNADFFKADNKNLLSGAGTSLSIDGLTKAETAFMEQVDPDGKPLGTMPALIVVPPALSAVASQLNKSMELRDTSSNAKYPVANPHQNKFRTEVSRYLSNAQYAGASGKAWYLLADPADLPVIETAFLNGQESPVIETAEADFNTLGVQMRGYHDFGVALQEARGGVKAAGE
jgi:hypothetical protein